MKRAAESEPEIIIKRFKPVFSTVGTVEFRDGVTQNAKISGDGSLIAVRERETRKLFLLSLNAETPKRALDMRSSACEFGFSGDSKILVTVDDKTVRCWDLNTDTPGDDFDLDIDWADHVTVNQNGSVAAVSGSDFVCVIDPKKRVLLRKIVCKPGRHVSITPNGKFVIIPNREKLLVLQPESDEEPKEMMADNGVAWDNDRAIVFCDGKTQSLNLNTMEMTVLFEEDISGDSPVDVCENGTILTYQAVTEEISFVNFWDANDRVHLQTEVSSIDSLLSADGKTMCRIFDQQDIHVLRRA